MQPRTALRLLVDVGLLIACLLHLSALLTRPRVPFDCETRIDGVFVRNRTVPDAAAAVEPGDRIHSAGGRDVFRREVLELVADFMAVDDVLAVQVQRRERTLQAGVRLVPQYTPYAIAVYYLIGLFTWAVAVYVLLRGPRGTAASVLHWGLISLAVVVMIGWEGVSPRSFLPPFFSSVLFFASYLGVTVCFLHFTLLFPRRQELAGAPWIFVPYLLSAVVVGLMLVLQWQAVARASMDAYRAFWLWFDVFHVLVLLWIVSAIGSFVVAWMRTDAVSDRRKLQWILFGLVLGPTPFIFLTVLPELLSEGPALAEEYTLPFLGVIPVALAISFIRYQIMDVRVVIRRTTSYSIVVGMLVLAYLGIVAVLAYAIGEYTRGTAVAAAVVTALAFEPLRRRVQHAVDRRFFRVEYDFRAAQRRFSEDLKACVTAREVADLLVRETDTLIPVERIGFFEMQQPGDRLRVLSHKGFDLIERRSIRLQAESLKTRLELPVAVTGKLESGIEHEPADGEVFERWGLVLVFPMLSQSLEILGFLAIGAKKSGRAFSSEDVDLLRTVATQASLELERVRLQVALVEERTRAERERAMSQLKSDFVSFVSHDLRTPLASIRMFAELLREKKGKLDSGDLDYVRIIEGEADRLARMVTNVLDVARIESGEGGYRPVTIDLRTAVRDAVDAMAYELRKHDVRTEITLGDAPIMVQADPVAVGQAVMNLVGNALKYAAEGGFVGVTLWTEDGFAAVSVADRGPGIRPEILPRLFEKFFRDEESAGRRQGIGLGLPLVKHIMTVHGGDVRVTSEPGAGSTFVLRFPLPDINAATHQPRRER